MRTISLRSAQPTRLRTGTSLRAWRGSHQDSLRKYPTSTFPHSISSRWASEASELWGRREYEPLINQQHYPTKFFFAPSSLGAAQRHCRRGGQDREREDRANNNIWNEGGRHHPHSHRHRLRCLHSIFVLPEWLNQRCEHIACNDCLKPFRAIAYRWVSEGD